MQRASSTDADNAVYGKRLDTLRPLKIYADVLLSIRMAAAQGIRTQIYIFEIQGYIQQIRMIRFVTMNQ